ncbi:MAG: hypothetical protein A2W28_09160 [Gammaproteobacteria bacterium RBG_16_51_14]|nr:MAG: hypothetical protein A2W28_09160 [Gammaproteobacteria bacterium RBG_16_51_14]
MITLLLAWITLSALASESINVFVGEIKILEVGAIDRVAVGNSKMLSTTMLDNGQLLLLAESEGETTIHIWYSDGSESDLKVSVLKKNVNRESEELRTLVEGLGDIEVREVGQRIYLTGNILKTDEELLKTIKSTYPELIDLTRKLDPIVPPQPPTVFPVDQNKMVYMDVKITEFNTSKLQTLGIDWSDAVSGPSAGLSYDVANNSTFRAAQDKDLAPSFAAVLPLSTPSALGFFGIASEITSRINLLATTGDAVILAEPKLSARSGGKAEFLAGGEIPVVTTGTLGSSNVEFKEFGIKLDISPVVDSENNILAHVGTEVSAVDQSNAVGGVPAFITRKTATDISMRDGETLVMSGLIDRDVGKNINKIPLLGDIPILGALFRSTNYNNNNTELVIFVTPTIYDSNSEFNRQRVERRKIILEQFKKNTDEKDLILD